MITHQRKLFPLINHYFSGFNKNMNKSLRFGLINFQ